MTGVPLRSEHSRNYRADIDGLRAIAVTLVLAYHVGFPYIPGGYVGVDVFFVLSGFLITGILLSEHQRTGTINLVDFWARRVRRLLPLACTVALVTLLVAYPLVAPLTRGRMLWDATSSIFYFSNLRFAGQSTAYSDAQVTDSLFLHYWSLSVEEQFYFVWPLLFLGAGLWAARHWRGHVRAVLFGVLVTGTLASLVTAIALTHQWGPSAYYLPQTRVWEIGVGALLAFGSHRLGFMRNWFASVLGATGLLAILLAAVTFSSATPFPGYAALLPVLGAAMLISSGVRYTTALVRGLSWGPITYIGRISYALYLWHWPVIGITTLANQRAGSPLSHVQAMVIAVGATLVLAAVSHVLIENPMRYSRRLRMSRRRTFGMAAAVSVLPAMVIGGLFLYGDLGGRAPVVTPHPSHAPDPSSPPTAIIPMTPLEASEDRVTVLDDNCHIAQDDPQPNFDCIAGDPSSVRTIVLLGDSHARHWLPALDDLGMTHGYRVMSHTKSACTPYDVRIYNTIYEREYDECAQWSDAVIEGLSSLDASIDLVIVARSQNYTSLILDGNARHDDIDIATTLWGEGAQRTLDRLATLSTRVVIMQDTPWSARVVPECLSEATHPSDCSIALANGVPGGHLFDAEVEFAPDMVEVISMNDAVCETDPCAMVTVDGLIKYRDAHHLTQTFSRQLASELGARLGLTSDGHRLDPQRGEP